MAFSPLKEPGIIPLSMLPSICRDNRTAHRPSADGISPDKLLLETFNRPRLIRFPICGGIVPVRLLFDKSNPKERE
uniref:Uncharacterized protein n=1 Tax=Arundo donax TaxID=35708 RepID=A0A0A9AAR3_ARUDO